MMMMVMTSTETLGRIAGVYDMETMTLMHHHPGLDSDGGNEFNESDKSPQNKNKGREKKKMTRSHARQ